MRTVSSINTVKRIIKESRHGSIGFVPTMGALHEGHLSLIKRAKKECDFLVVSLFVNPLQFGPEEDLDVYPRNLALDQGKARAAGVNLFWTPFKKTLYPAGFQTTIAVSQISRLWEGLFRPEHFTGVCTIVTKLLHVVQPNRLYLGQKDYQQICVLQRMIQDLNIPVQLRVCPTVRETDGLAMSSRNLRLSAKQRNIAPLLYRALKAAKKRVTAGEQHAHRIIQTAEAHLKSNPDIRCDYLALCDPKTLEPIKKIEHRAVLLAAIHIGKVRLIDNILLKTP